MAGIAPALSHERTKNPLRPNRLRDVIGQAKAKHLMRRAVDAAFRRSEPLAHTLLVAQSGTGKSTFSHAVANEMRVDVFDVEAPVSADTLLELRTTMQHGDILRIEEIHQQAIMDRRGKQSSTQPEVLYSIMEDRTIATATGILEYPRITVIGTTTDEGMLPDAFVNRFPIRPRLVEYTTQEMLSICFFNANALDIAIDPNAAAIFARASRAIPREMNNLMRNASILAQVDGYVSVDDAHEVLEINEIATDGLTADMQRMLTFLYERARRESKDGEVTYQASLSTIATAIGKSRDSKAVALRVEPFLIGKGFIQVGHGGRTLTDAGQVRAKELLNG